MTLGQTAQGVHATSIVTIAPPSTNSTLNDDAPAQRNAAERTSAQCVVNRSTFGLRPIGDLRRIRLESAFIHEVGRLRPAVRARIVGTVAAALTTCGHTVRARLSGARTLRGSRLADVDSLELRVDDGPWSVADDIRAA